VRAELAAGATVTGPSLIVEDQTSTFVPGNFAARISGAGHIVIETKREAKT
jgi:N-methylhydantoinase A